MEIKKFFLWWVFSVIVFLLHAFYVGSAVWGDGRYYYVYLQSVVIDQDLDFSNERIQDGFYFDLITTPTGKVFNKYAIGPALFWSVGYIPFHILLNVVNIIFNTSLELNGYSFLYQIAVGITAVTYGVAGLYFSYLAVASLVEKRIAMWATGIVFLASNAFFYIAIDPINSHPISIFLSGLFFYLLSQLKNKTEISLAKIISISLVLGGVMLVRAQDIILWILLLLILWAQKRSLISFFIQLMISLLVVGVVFMPQIFQWKDMLGTFTNPYLYIGETFNWPDPQILKVLFSFNNGLFIYSPIFLLSLVGIYFKIGLSFARYLLLIFLLQTYIIASWHGWWGGASYGGRMFLSLLPIFILGLGWFYQKYEPRLSKPVILSALGSIILVNWASIVFVLLSL